MKNFILTTMIAAMFVVFTTTTVSAQEKSPKSLTSLKVEKSRGNSTREAATVNIADKEQANPEKSRGAWCDIQIDNWTGYYVNVWVDNTYKGMLSPWGEGWVSVGSGWTKVYCETSGGTKYWDAEGSCDGDFYFKLVK